RDPLEELSYGLKLEGDYTFQNQIDAATSTGKYKPYLAKFVAGPYVKYEVIPKVAATLEVSGSPHKFLKDVDGANRRTGKEGLVRLSVENNSGNRFWNPSGNLSYDLNSTEGTEFRSKTWGLGFADQMILTDLLRLSVSLDLARALYDDRPSFPRK